MDKRIFTSVLIILMALAAMGGATLAWFTAEVSIDNNVFTAGTVLIEADETVPTTPDFYDNWNPGDCSEKEFKITNAGTKDIYVRAKFTARWEPKNLSELSPEDKEEFLELIDFTEEEWDTFWEEDNEGWLDIINVLIKYQDGEDGWVFIEDDDDMNPWLVKDDDGNYWLTAYYYYKGKLDGEYGNTDGGFAEFKINVCLSGPLTDNYYQGATFTLGTTFEAIQASHEAAFEKWDVGFVGGTWVPVSYNDDDNRWETNEEVNASYWYWDEDDKGWKVITSS